jgi:3-hydroxymyristoyl/3-hydroxydecanoyl-(acyl carrier protein) dehydratase
MAAALPPVRARRPGPDAETVLDLEVGPGLPAFQGHFPGDPILPGVVQVDWAARFGSEAFGPLGPFLGLAQLKFHQPIRPGRAVELHLAFDPARGRLRFAYRGGPELLSAGVIQFAERP